MKKKTLAAIVAILLFCAISAFVLVRCTDVEDVSRDVSSEISESSDVDESTVSEPSDASEVEESLTDVSDTSKDPAPETSTPAEESDVSEPSADTSKTPDVSDPPSDESSEPSETSKVEEPSQPDEPSEPEDTSTTPSEIVKPNQPNEESKAEETSKDETSKDETSKEENVVKGDTPVTVVVGGKESDASSYEEATEILADILTVEKLEAAEKGYVLVLELKNTRTFTANGDGTYVCSNTGRTYTAEKIVQMFEAQFCPYCGHRKGDGTNGTCVNYLHDTNCHQCGEECKALACHSCDE